MPLPDELGALDATAQAQLVRTREVTPLELVDAAIARIEALEPSIHALTTNRFERAREEAGCGAADGPFAGVPFLFKDLACSLQGEPDHEGMAALKDADWHAPITTFLARRFRDAGLLVLGRTNTPELGIMPTTEPLSYGPTHNPWDVGRTPGGSSGGAAAAVASGMVPVAHASDGGGSIRIPASCCGLVGLKPSRGRISVGPASSELARFLSVQFAVTRTVRDCAALLDVATGTEVGDPIVAPIPARPYVQEIGADPGQLRVGLMTTHPGTSDPLEPECAAAAEHAARLLESFGHHVEVAHPDPLDEPDRISSFMAVWGALQAGAIETWGKALGRTLGPEDVEPLTWLLVQQGREISAVEYLAAVTAMQAWCRRMQLWWAGADDGGADFDLLLTPTLGELPLPLGVLQTPDAPIAGYSRAATFTPYTPAFNQTGQPAISLPLHHSADGLPVGVHLVAAYGREDLLVRVAAQLEAAAPWAHRRPSVWP